MRKTAIQAEKRQKKAVGFWPRPRLPRGFWRRLETLNVLRAVLAEDLRPEEALDLLGGRERVNLADIQWYVSQLTKTVLSEVKRVALGQGGRVVIPAPYRQALGLHEGDELRIRLENGEVRLTTPGEALKRAQALVRRHVPAGRSLAEALISERRRDARRE